MWWFFVFYVSFAVLVPLSKQSAQTEAKVLFNADSHNLWFVGVLHLNLNWHGVLPLPLFVFIFSQRLVA